MATYYCYKYTGPETSQIVKTIELRNGEKKRIHLYPNSEMAFLEVNYPNDFSSTDFDIKDRDHYGPFVPNRPSVHDFLKQSDEMSRLKAISRGATSVVYTHEKAQEIIEKNHSIETAEVDLHNCEILYQSSADHARTHALTIDGSNPTKVLDTFATHVQL